MGLFKKRKVILVLGGGGARGLCSIGVLKVLERHFGHDKMPFDMIIGTSIGSLIGGAYCLGMTPEELEQKAYNFTWQKIVDLGFHPTGLVRGDKFRKIILDITGGKSFKDMQIPFALTTTILETGGELTHVSGNLSKLVQASCAWPGVFAAVEADGILLSDGGVRNSVPTKAAKEFEATFIMAINPGFGIKKQKVKNAVNALIQTVQIMGEELNTYQAEVADVVIKPVLENIDQFDFDKAEFIIKQGELAAEKKIRQLKRKLSLHW